MKRLRLSRAKTEARLRDTTPMWELVVSRLHTIVAGQENNSMRLDAIEGLLDAIEGKLGRLDVIKSEIRQLRGRNERLIES